MVTCKNLLLTSPAIIEKKSTIKQSDFCSETCLKASPPLQGANLGRNSGTQRRVGPSMIHNVFQLLSKLLYNLSSWLLKHVLPNLKRTALRLPVEDVVDQLTPILVHLP